MINNDMNKELKELEDEKISDKLEDITERDIDRDKSFYKTFEIRKIIMAKLFPKLNSVILNNLQIDEESVSYITPYLDAHKITEILIKHITKYKIKDATTIVDCTGGVGGDTIAFCSVFGRVVSIELDSKRYEMLTHNLKTYGFSNYDLINGDSLLIVPKLSSVDIIYVDPPWGGREYKTKQILRLEFGTISVEQFVLNCFNKELSVSCPKIVALKLPKNYDLKYLYEMLSMYEIYLYELKKINIILIENKI